MLSIKLVVHIISLLFLAFLKPFAFCEPLANWKGWAIKPLINEISMNRWKKKIRASRVCGLKEKRRPNESHPTEPNVFVGLSVKIMQRPNESLILLGPNTTFFWRIFPSTQCNQTEAKLNWRKFSSEEEMISRYLCCASSANCHLIKTEMISS